MAFPQSLQVALKEWASVCQAVEQGRQILLLRKGGIYESAGEFEVEHREFLLFPTYLHQSPTMLKSSEHPTFESRSQEPDEVKLSAAGEVTDIIQLQSRGQMDALDDEHIWTNPLVDMRFNYRPENPLYLLLVRAYRLPHAANVPNAVDYAGCKSWVPLKQTVSTAGAEPVLSEEEYEQRRRRILEKLGVVVRSAKS